MTKGNSTAFDTIDPHQKAIERFSKNRREAEESMRQIWPDYKEGNFASKM